jgi:hypothetical protein
VSCGAGAGAGAAAASLTVCCAVQQGPAVVWHCDSVRGSACYRFLHSTRRPAPELPVSLNNPSPPHQAALWSPVPSAHCSCPLLPPHACLPACLQ